MKGTHELIAKVVRDVTRQMANAVRNSLYDKEDLTQELWVKALEVKDKYSDRPENEFRKILFTSLKNHARKIINWSASRPDTSYHSGEMKDEEGNNILESILADNDNFVKRIEDREFVAKLRDLLQQTNLSYKSFIDEYLSPDNEIWEKWEELKEEKPMYKQYDYPPIMTFITLRYGVSKTRAKHMINRIRELAEKLI